RALPSLHRGAPRRARVDRVGPRGPRREHVRRRLRARLRRRHALARRRVGRGAVGALLLLVAAGRVAALAARGRATRGVPPRLRRAVRDLPRRRPRTGAAALPDDVRPAALIELHDPAGAFAALEAYLDEGRFWGRDDVVADVYLGYGLSDPLRRSALPPPPEPCALPLLACRIRPVRCQTPAVAGGYSLGAWRRS